MSTRASDWIHKSQTGAVLSLALVFLALALSWTQALDHIAEKFLSGQIATSLELYAADRGINAIVSVLQTSQIDFGPFSGDIGELLDPINDMAERFADVMTYSIAGLFILKALLLITKTGGFAWLITFSALAYAGCRFYLPRFSGVSFRIFLTLLILRLSFVVFLILVHGVDILVQGELNEGRQQFSYITRQLRTMEILASSTIPGNQDITKNKKHPIKKRKILKNSLGQKQKKADLIKEIKALNKDIIVLNTKIQEKDQEIKKLQKRIDERGKDEAFYKRSWKSVKGLFSPDPIHSKLSILEKEKDDIEKKLDNKKDQKREREDQLECVKKNMAGQSCSFLELIKNKATIPFKDSGELFGEMAQSLIQKSGKMVDSITSFGKKWFHSALNIMGITLLKVVLLPLFYVWLLYSFLKSVWRRLTSHDVTRTRLLYTIGKWGHIWSAPRCKG